MKCYIMRRKGSFLAKTPSSNQCKGTGHRRYHYICVLVFSPNSPLDRNGFLIDHNEVGSAIESCHLSGSCEQMHQDILVAVKKVLSRKRCKINGIKLVIRPEGDSSVAELTYLWTLTDRYVKLLNT